MSRPTPRRLVYSSLLGVILLSASSALFVNCTGNDHANAPTGECAPRGRHRHPHPPLADAGVGTAPNIIYCSGAVDCTNSAYFPVCGDYDTATCIAPNSPPSAPKECIFRVAEDTGCFCLERDIRACTISGSTQGIQHCVATGSWATGWGGCGST